MQRLIQVRRVAQASRGIGAHPNPLRLWVKAYDADPALGRLLRRTRINPNEASFYRAETGSRFDDD